MTYRGFLGDEELSTISVWALRFVSSAHIRWFFPHLMNCSQACLRSQGTFQDSKALSLQLSLLLSPTLAPLAVLGLLDSHSTFSVQRDYQSLLSVPLLVYGLEILSRKLVGNFIQPTWLLSSQGSVSRVA